MSGAPIGWLGPALVPGLEARAAARDGGVQDGVQITFVDESQAEDSTDQRSHSTPRSADPDFAPAMHGMGRLARDRVVIDDEFDIAHDPGAVSQDEQRVDLEQRGLMAEENIGETQHRIVLVGLDGTVSLPVADDGREGTATTVVLLDPIGNIIAKAAVTVGG